jgi:hypothetical protein
MEGRGNQGKNSPGQAETILLMRTRIEYVSPRWSSRRKIQVEHDSRSAAVCIRNQPAGG